MPIKSRKRRNKKLNTGIFIALIIVIGVATFWIGKTIHDGKLNADAKKETSATYTKEKKKKNNEFSLNSVKHNSKNDLGYETITVEQENYKIFYPSINVKSIDDKLISYVDKFISDFKNIKGDYKSVDYDVYLSEQNLLSVVYKIKGYNKTGSIIYADFFVKNFKLNNGEELLQEDIFKDGFYKVSSKLVKEHFEKDEVNSKLTKDERFLNNIKAKKENFKNYSFNENGCILYFSGESLFNQPSKLYSVSLKYDDVYEHMKIEKDGSSKVKPTEPPTEKPTEQKKENQSNNQSEKPSASSSKPMIAITYDDGPSSIYTNQILDVLKENNAKATFFVLGGNAQYNTDILQRQINEGHQIGNHTMDHKSLPSLSKEGILQQVEDLNKIVKDATGYNITVVRPPYGAFDGKVQETLNQYALMLWNVDTLDWQVRNKNTIVQNVMDNASDGSIILLHDIYKETADATKEFIPKLVAEGYQLVTIDEFYKHKGMTLEGGGSYG